MTRSFPCELVGQARAKLQKLITTDVLTISAVTMGDW